MVPIFGLIDEYTALNVVPPVLRNIARNDSIAGVVLWVESPPGGYVGPVREIYSTVRKLDLVKPVVAYTGGMAASGGYYIAVGAERIIADPPWPRSGASASSTSTTTSRETTRCRGG